MKRMLDSFDFLDDLVRGIRLEYAGLPSFAATTGTTTECDGEPCSWAPSRSRNTRAGRTACARLDDETPHTPTAEEPSFSGSAVVYSIA